MSRVLGNQEYVGEFSQVCNRAVTKGIGKGNLMVKHSTDLRRLGEQMSRESVGLAEAAFISLLSNIITHMPTMKILTEHLYLFNATLCYLPINLINGNCYHANITAYLLSAFDAFSSSAFPLPSFSP